ncbi:MAG: PTS sugar transporter subunit IIA [Lachnospiraceae bacterium]|nr:PTS sugar transporter subunit IIA [Lachnospiraceae bacterium]MDE6186428.1 PTS sugar transporter subunit IIA [Lachnospiraceae bacterium]MDE7285872.1 PTS sugar transporter subunit IIA [Lachnospiraceae bacterium]
MTGIIFTGHGTFASGMHSAVSLLAGESDHVLSVDFPGESVELLKEKLHTAISDLFEKQCQQIIILCDLLSGSPFNASVTISQGHSNIYVIYGINVAIAVELCLRADDAELSEADLFSVLEDSQEMTGLFRLSQDKEDTSGCMNDGI